MTNPQTRIRPGIAWPVFVHLDTDEGVVTIGAHNVLWIKPHRDQPERLTAIKTRGSEQSIAIIGLPVDHVRAAIDGALSQNQTAFARDVASALLQQRGL